MKITQTQLVLMVTLVAVLSSAVQAQPLPTLKVSDNHRFLVTSRWQAVFLLGDTAWELFHRLNREEAEQYLKNRAAKRLHRHSGRGTGGTRRPEHSECHMAIRPLIDNDPARPKRSRDLTGITWITS